MHDRLDKGVLLEQGQEAYELTAALKSLVSHHSAYRKRHLTSLLHHSANRLAKIDHLHLADSWVVQEYHNQDKISFQ